MHHPGLPGHQAHKGQGVLVHADDVAGVHEQAVVAGVHPVDDPLHPVHAVDEKAVVFQHGHDAFVLGVCADFVHGLQDGRQLLVEIVGGVLLQGAAPEADVVAHPGQAQFRRDVHIPLDPVDLFALGLPFLQQVAPHGIVHQGDAGVFGGLLHLLDEGGVDFAGGLLVKAEADGHQFKDLSAVFGRPVNGTHQGQFACAQGPHQGIGTQTNSHMRLLRFIHAAVSPPGCDRCSSGTPGRFPPGLSSRRPGANCPAHPGRERSCPPGFRRQFL